MEKRCIEKQHQEPQRSPHSLAAISNPEPRYSQCEYTIQNAISTTSLPDCIGAYGYYDSDDDGHGRGDELQTKGN